MAELGATQHREVATTIATCLTVEQPKSFFLYAGAGSGKTRSLVDALDAFRDKYGQRFRFRGQQIAVITYTNAACDEIRRRIAFDPIVSVTTIHSFVWELIRGFNVDIREWLQENLKREIAELHEAARKGRAGSKAAIERERDIVAKQSRLDGLPAIKSFTYSPNGDNRTRDSLNHAEVIQLGATFLGEKPLMRRLLVSGSPFVLIDESQDTNKLLMEALLAVQVEQRECFGLGLFGDTMQRIYADGKVDLGKELPVDWARPEKTVNYRCPKRVIRLINQIRSSADGRAQVAGEDNIEGHVRLFIVPSTIADKQRAEMLVREAMATATADEEWKDRTKVKTLTLEHHMAAKRMGFFEMFGPLSTISEFRTGLIDGSLPIVRFFVEQVLPLVTAHRKGDRFTSAAIVRKLSPILRLEAFTAAKVQREQITKANAAVVELGGVCDPSRSATFQNVLDCVATSGLFEIPDALFPFVTSESANTGEEPANSADEPDTERSQALRTFLSSPFVQIEPYAEYVSGLAIFGTHQGVKGLEFPRVVVVMDDEEARGFMFSYEKLFGVKDKSKADIENEKAGIETSIERTRRLFYVTCSRSEESLAIIAYTANTDALRRSAIAQGWFDESEVIALPV